MEPASGDDAIVETQYEQLNCAYSAYFNGEGGGGSLPTPPPRRVREESPPADHHPLHCRGRTTEGGGLGDGIFKTHLRMEDCSGETTVDVDDVNESEDMDN